jgi:membrane-associated phospholipid phosphatase
MVMAVVGSVHKPMQLLMHLATRLTGAALPLSGTERLALLVSTAGSPFLTPLYTACAVIWPLAEDGRQFLVWSGMIAIFFIGVGLAYVVVQVLRGRISDVHVSQQSQRHRPFTVAVSSSTVGAVILWWIGAPWTLVALGSSFAIQGLCFGVLTVYEKISMHVAVSASCLTALILLFGWIAVPLLGFLPIQGWARIYRRRHTPGQVIAGALLAPALTLLTLVPWRLSGLVG